MLNINRFAQKMKNKSFYLAFNFFLSVAVVCAALLGSSLGIQHGPALAISVVWPATGFSLAALLLFGYEAALGVFMGNFAYNFLFLKYPITTHLIPFNKIILTTFISLGSLVQALVSTYIIRTNSTPLIFRTLKDIVIFLVPASILSCLIGSTVGVASLVAFGGLDKSMIIPVWFTFWLGDTIGIYVMTPLLIVWTMRSQKINVSDHLLAIACMVALFIIFSFTTYISGHTLPHLFLLVSISAAYLFRMYGASLSIFLMTAVSIAFATFFGFKGTFLISPITFIGVTVVSSLIIAAVVNEREEALALLDSRNLYLRKEVDVKVEALEHIHKEISQKRKLATRGFVSKLLTVQADAPLNKIEEISKTSQETLMQMQEVLERQKNLTPEEKMMFFEKLGKIEKGLSDTLEAQKLISELFRFLAI